MDSGKEGRGRGTESCGTCGKLFVQRLYVDRYLFLVGIGQAVGKPEQQRRQERNDFRSSRLHFVPGVCRHLLKEVVSHTSRLTAAMSFSRGIGMLQATVGADVVFHAQQAIGVMVVGENRHCCHQQADNKQYISNVPFEFHSGIFLSGAKINFI